MPDSAIILRQSKLQRPRVPLALVARPRLWSMLDEGINRPLTLVCAGPGFGKTTLVSSWLAQREISGDAAVLPTAWLSLDEQDSDLGVFLNYLIAAIRTKLGDVCAETLALLHSPQQPTARILFTSLINELVALSRPVAVVLDDYSALTSDGPTELLVELLRSWPQPLHLVIVTRRNPPLPLPQVRARDDITEIRSQHLRFSWHETRDYLYQVFAGQVGEETVSAFDQQSEGWIAGIKLAVMAAREVQNVGRVPSILPGNTGVVAEYLVDEVMASQPWAVQRFLLETSILDHFSAPLAQSVITATEDWDAAACIAVLVRADLFIVALDPEHEWYRYHQLFRDFLRRQLQRSTSAAQIFELHRRAAQWFSLHGFVDTAVHHALQANDLSLASSMLGQAIYEALNREDRATLDRWLGVLPDDFIQSRPELLLLRAMSMQFAWQLGAQQRLIPKIEALLAREVKRSSLELQGMYAQLGVLRLQQAYFSMDFAAAIQECEQVLAHSPKTWTYLRGAAMLYLGPSMQARGEYEIAQRRLLDAYEQYSDKSDGFALRICLGLCFMYVAEGQLELARQTAIDMLRHSQVRKLVTMECWARYYLGLVHYHWNELEVAQVYLEGVLNLRHSAITVAVREGLALLALIQSHLGQPATLQTLERMRELDLSQNGRETEATRAIRARLQVLAGAVDEAGRWADAFVASVPEQPLHWVCDPFVARVYVLLARREPNDLTLARQTLADLASIAERTRNKYFLIQCLVMRAVTEDWEGHTTVAYATLDEAIDLAAIGGFTRVLLDFKEDIQRLLASMSKQIARQRKLAPALIALLPELQAATNSASLHPLLVSPATVGEYIEPLTARELEVLALLREPLSTKEIARKLFISTSTVKRHTINIYGKLGVSRRWDAVAKAERLGQLKPR